MGSISGLKNPIYYLIDLCTCSIMDPNHSENDLLLMKLFLMNTISKEHNVQVFFWRYYWGLDNSPLVIML